VASSVAKRRVCETCDAELNDAEIDAHGDEFQTYLD
jgi:hypothetical protein